MTFIYLCYFPFCSTRIFIAIAPTVVKQIVVAKCTMVIACLMTFFVVMSSSADELQVLVFFEIRMNILYIDR